MLKLEINGQDFSNFVSITARPASLDNLSGSFSAEATVNEFSLWPLSVGDKARVLVDTTPIITGYIDGISVSHSTTSHVISLSGNDKTIDVVETSMGDQSAFNGGTTFPALIELALKVSGITGISVINKVSDLRPIAITDLEEAETGGAVFDFIDKYAKKLQVLLTSDGNGNIVIVRGKGQSINTNLIKKKNNDSNNILSSNVSYTITERFYKYVVKSQSNVSSGQYNIGESAEDLSNRFSDPIFDKKLEKRQNRTLITESDTPLNKEELTELARWEANIRRVRGMSYSCTVQGFFPPGLKLPWGPGGLITIDDDYSRISPSAEMLVNSVEFNYSLSGGSITTLSFVDKDAYTLEANKPQKDERTSPDGIGFPDDP